MMRPSLLFLFPWIALVAAWLVLNPGAGSGQEDTRPDRTVNVTGPSVPLNLPTPKSRGFLNRWLASDLSVTVLQTPNHGRITLREQDLRPGQPVDPSDIRLLRYVSEDYHPRPGRLVYEVRDRRRASQAVIALNARPRDFVSVLEEPIDLTPGESHEFRFSLTPPEDGDPTTLRIYAAAARGTIDMHDGTGPNDVELSTYALVIGGESSPYWHETLLAERTLDRASELRLTYVYEPDPERPWGYNELIVMFDAEDIHRATTREIFVAVHNGPETCAERLHPTVSREQWMELIPPFQEDLIRQIFRETGIETGGTWTGNPREIYRNYLYDLYSARNLEAIRKFIEWYERNIMISDSLGREFRPLTEFAAGAGDLRAVGMLRRHSSGADREMWRFVHRILSASGAEHLQLADIDLYAPEHRPWDNPFAEWSARDDTNFAIGRKKAWRWLACQLASMDRSPDAD
jgi:hypothetical protein